MEIRPDKKVFCTWLRSWFTQQQGAEPADVLTWAWLYGEAHAGSDWTRDKELADWISASASDWLSWEAVRRLLGTLLNQGQPLPFALLLWALEVAAEKRTPPIRKRGRDATRNVFRNRNIAFAVQSIIGYGSRRPPTYLDGQPAI